MLVNEYRMWGWPTIGRAFETLFRFGLGFGYVFGALVGCGADDTKPTEPDPLPPEETLNCGELAPELKVVCRDMDPTVQTTDSFDGTVMPGPEPVSGDLSIPCDLFEPEDDGSQVYVSYEAQCTEPLVEEGEVSAELSYSAYVERLCGRSDRGSTAGTFPTWVASLRLPEDKRYRVEVESSSSVETPYCHFKVGATETDPVTIGLANLLIAEEQGPKDLALALECDGEFGYVFLSCYGFDPNGPELAASKTGATAFRVVATPLE